MARAIRQITTVGSPREQDQLALAALQRHIDETAGEGGGNSFPTIVATQDAAVIDMPNTTIAYLLVDGNSADPTHWTIAELHFPNLTAITGTFVIKDTWLLTTIDMPLLASSWVQVYSATGLTAISLPSLTASSNVDVRTNDDLITLDLPLLETANLQVTVAGNNSLETVNLPSLVTCSGGFSLDGTALTTVDISSLTTVSGPMSLVAAPSLTSLDLSSLASVAGALNISSNDVLASIDLSSLTSTTDNVQLNTNPELTTIVLNSALVVNSGTLIFSENALTQACVDDILAKMDAGGQTNQQLLLDGGTNATPSAAGLASKANLVGKGWTVTNN